MAESNSVIPFGLGDAIRNLGIAKGELVALVGGGGKSTLLFAFGNFYGSGTILTTTTKMGANQVGRARLLVNPSLNELTSAVAEPDPVLIWDRVNESKAVGVDPSIPVQWLNIADRVIVEADGSRGYPAKAPAPYEPVIPNFTKTVIAVIGADAIDRVIEDQCHRPLRVGGLLGCSPYERLTTERTAQLLLHPDGLRKGVTSDIRFKIAITKVSESNLSLASEVVQQLTLLNHLF